MFNKISKSNIIVKSVMTSIAVFFVGASMALMSFADVGPEPITILAQGISRSLFVSEGIAVYIQNAVFITFLLFFNRAAINGATVISFLITGTAMNIFTSLLKSMFATALGVVARHIMNIAGSVMLGAFIGIYLLFDFGASPADGVMLWINKKLHIPYRYCIWLLNAACLLIGVALGGTVGFGSLISTFLIGLVCNFVTDRFAPQNKHSDYPSQ